MRAGVTVSVMETHIAPAVVIQRAAACEEEQGGPQ